MNEESNYPQIDPELEARIVALVLGEASDFERAEVDRLIAQRPELEAFKAQMQTVHGMLDEIGAMDSSVEDDWKLPPERRSAVLSVMGGQIDESPTEQIVQQVVAKRNPWIKNLYGKWIAVAAVLLCAVGLGGFTWVGLAFRRQVTRIALSKAADSAGAMESAKALDTEIS